MTTLIIPTVLQGAAVACFFIPLVTITLSGLPPSRIPSASGVSNFVRIMAGGFGTSISTTLWENRAAMHHAHLAESISAGNPATAQALSSLQASGFDGAQSLAMLDRLVNVQSYVLGGRRHLLRLGRHLPRAPASGLDHAPQQGGRGRRGWRALIRALIEHHPVAHNQLHSRCRALQVASTSSGSRFHQLLAEKISTSWKPR